MTPDLQSLLVHALGSPCGVGIRSARPAALISALNSALAEAGGGTSALCARMGQDPSEVWLAPRAILPALSVVGSLGPAPSVDFSTLTLDDLDHA